MRTAIKQDLSPILNILDYAIWDVLENKTTATFRPNIGSLKTAIEEERNKMSEEFILKACKSFRWRVDTIIEKNDDHIDHIYTPQASRPKNIAKRLTSDSSSHNDVLINWLILTEFQTISDYYKLCYKVDRWNLFLKCSVAFNIWAIQLNPKRKDTGSLNLRSIWDHSSLDGFSQMIKTVVELE